MVLLGLMLQEKGDPGAAFVLHRRAAEAGDPGGAYALGLAYRDGIGTEIDGEAAARWFDKAAANGDETAARATLDRALALDPANDLAKKLAEQIRADAQKELGAVFFRYTVQRDDTLSKLAQQHLGDRYRFYILAKYNEIANPSRLAAGQVIKIPGREPPMVAKPEPPVAPPPKFAEPEPKPRDEFVDVLAKGSELEKSGNLEGAYAHYADAAQRNPGNGEIGKRRDAVKVRLVGVYDREATQAFQRQNLDLAISKWDRILEIDPQNRKARLERERALDLKRRMAQKFGSK